MSADGSPPEGVWSLCPQGAGKAPNPPARKLFRPGVWSLCPQGVGKGSKPPYAQAFRPPCAQAFLTGPRPPRAATTPGRDHPGPRPPRAATTPGRATPGRDHQGRDHPGPRPPRAATTPGRDHRDSLRRSRGASSPQRQAQRSVTRSSARDPDFQRLTRTTSRHGHPWERPSRATETQRVRAVTVAERGPLRPETLSRAAIAK